jgi:signal transduction histidine kinase
MIARMVQNLIANVIKFPGDRPPRIHLSAELRERDWVFALRDGGSGPGQFDRIFQIFERVERAGEDPGTGLGLAICKSIVEQHGGRMWVHSSPGEGSAFHFTIRAEGAVPCATQRAATAT